MTPPLIHPLVWVDAITLAEANECLERWCHKMGPLRRGNQSGWCHGLMHEDRIVAVTTASTLITPAVGNGLGYMTRDNTVELSRLCAERPGLCRVMLRLWREFVFPALGYMWAISYQDAKLHSGKTYRFDGWKRHSVLAHSGRDTRSGRIGRYKWVWIWPANKDAQ